MQGFAVAAKAVMQYFSGKGFNVSVTTLSLKEMRKNALSFADAIEWLLGAHIHVVLTHPHQGLEGSGWGVEEVYEEVRRLYYHTGFPCLENLKCPVFCQDKWRYLCLLPPNMKLPSLKLSLDASVNIKHISAEVQR